VAKKAIRDVGASVRARLHTLARERGQPLDLLLTRYALERLLYRLSVSRHWDRFVLKGAMLVTSWIDDPNRATRDLDLLGFGEASAEALLPVFRDICAIEVDDGLRFDTDGLRVDVIREGLEYGGLRLRTTATLAAARITVVVDVAFGDSLVPGVEEVDLPVLLDFPAPHLLAYARETVIAEKFQAMVALGRANSRMKDFYDVWVLSHAGEYRGDRLPRAIAATFARRRTPLPEEVPDALTPAFARDDGKRRQWAAFTRDLALEAPSLENVIGELAAFLAPMAERARRLPAA
jgi:predicted nucleotidyltransferase component of viral defense system